MLPKLNQLVIECIITNQDTSVHTYNLPPTPNSDDTPISRNKHMAHSTIGQEAPIQHNPFSTSLCQSLFQSSQFCNHAIAGDGDWVNESLDMVQDAQLSAFQTIFNWAISNQRKSSFNFATIYAPRSQSAVLKEVCNGLSINTINIMDEFKPQWIPWQPHMACSSLTWVKTQTKF